MHAMYNFTVVSGTWFRVAGHVAIAWHVAGCRSYSHCVKNIIWFKFQRNENFFSYEDRKKSPDSLKDFKQHLVNMGDWGYSDNLCYKS